MKFFRNMIHLPSGVNIHNPLAKKLLLILLIKLFIIFIVLKLFFFPNFLKSNFKSDKERSNFIINSLTNIKK